MEADRDPVSLMQESVDQLALAMFDSLRLIPFAEEVTRAPKPAVHAAEPVPGTPILRAVATDAAWSEKVQSLAQGVLKQASILDDLIDTLPGAELCEEKQMEELARLDEDGRRNREELAIIVSKAEELTKGVNDSLDNLAERMLHAPR